MKDKAVFSYFLIILLCLNIILNLAAHVEPKAISLDGNNYPRLFFDLRDLNRIRLQINASTYLRYIWRNVKKTCDSILSEEIKVFVPMLWNPELSKYRSWSTMLAIGYAISGDERYARKAADILRAMFKVQETYGKIDPETIHIGYAAHTFLLAYDCVGPSGVLNEKDIHDAKVFFRQIGNQLRSVIFDHRGNWAMCESAALVQISLYFPDFPESEEWFNAGKRRMEELLLMDFADDGGELELAPTYVQLCAFMVGIFAEVAKRFRGIDYYSIRFRGKTIQDIFRWLFYIMTPGGLMPAIHDSGRSVRISVFELGAARYRDGVLKFAARKAFDWTNRSKELGLGEYLPNDLEYALIWADETVKPTPPNETTVLLPSSGFAVFRSGWDLNAHYLIYKYGPFGIGHQHYDKHSVEIWAYGSPLILDAGTMHYGDPMHTKWDIQTISHNTVMVNLVSQRPCDGRLIFFKDSPTFTAVSASAETYQGVTHIRTIVFDKLIKYYLFIDRLESSADNLYTLLWHIRGSTQFPIKPPEMEWRTPEGVGVLLIFSGPDELDVELSSGPASGFGYIPYASLQTRGRNVTLITLVIPYVREKPQAKMRSALSDSGLMVNVEVANRTLIYLMPYTGKSLVSIGSLKSEARIVFIEEREGALSRLGAINVSDVSINDVALLRLSPRSSIDLLFKDDVFEVHLENPVSATLSLYTGVKPRSVILNGVSVEPLFEMGYVKIELRDAPKTEILIFCPGPLSLGITYPSEVKYTRFILPSITKYLVKYSPIILGVIFVVIILLLPLLRQRLIKRVPYEKRREKIMKELEVLESRYSTGDIPYATYLGMRKKIEEILFQREKTRKEMLEDELLRIKEMYLAGEISYHEYAMRRKRVEEDLKNLTEP